MRQSFQDWVPEKPTPDMMGWVYGVPALAGKVLSLEGGSKQLQVPGETSSDRLKPGLHTVCPVFACEITASAIPAARYYARLIVIDNMTGFLPCLRALTMTQANESPVKGS